MDMPLLDGLPDDAIFDDAKVDTDLFSSTPPTDTNYFLLSEDPFLEDPPQPHPSQPSTQPPLALSVDTPTCPSLPDMPLSTKPPSPSKQLLLDPFSIPDMSTLPASPLQENRPTNTMVSKPKSKSIKKDPKPPLSPDTRNKEKLAQRKLRNKESARRYREKQVARRRQLENFTRTLTEQNRELESLHDRLLTLTCERRVRGIDVVGLQESVSGQTIPQMSQQQTNLL